MTDAIDLTTEQRNQLSALLRRFIPGVAVWAYGSRVKWTARPNSDLDLVAFAHPTQRPQVSELKEALAESNLPFPVDLHVWDDVPERFREIIRKEYVMVQEAKQPESKKSVPIEWQRHEVSKLLADGKLVVGDGYRAKNSELSRTGLPFARAGNINNGFQFAEADHFPSDALSRVSNKVSQPGDVVFTSKGTVGRFAFVREDTLRFVYSPQLCFWRSLDQALIRSRFLYYWMHGSEFFAQFKGVAGQTDMAEYVSLTDQRRMHITLPPLPEQRAIAHILGTLDDKIELNRRMNETLEAMARALFKSWFVDFDPVRAKAEGRDPGLPKHLANLFPSHFVDSDLGEIPEGWEVVTLPDVIAVNPTRSLQKDKNAPYLDMANMPTRGHTPDAIVDRPFGSGMRFMNGDTLVARITPCLENGKTAFVDFLAGDEVGWGSTEYIVLRAKSPLPEEFSYCLARSDEFRDFAIQSMTGTSGRQRVPPQALSHYRLVKPSKPVAALFGQMVRPLFAKASHAARESRTLAALRDMLLPKLISGEIRVNRGKTVVEGVA